MTYFGKHKTDREELISLQQLENKIDAVKTYTQKRDETAAELTKRMNSRTKPPVHRAALPTASHTMPTAEAVAAEIIRQQNIKPLTGLAKTAAAFRAMDVSKTASPAKPAAIPGNLTGLARVAAAFKAQNASKTSTKSK